MFIPQKGDGFNRTFVCDQCGSRFTVQPNVVAECPTCGDRDAFDATTFADAATRRPRPADVLRAATECPIITAILMEWERGSLSWDEALLWMVVQLHQAGKQWREQALEAMRRWPRNASAAAGAAQVKAEADPVPSHVVTDSPDQVR